MIPLRDANPSRTIPFITYLLILINFIVFFFELSIGKYQNDLFLHLGLIPSVWIADVKLFHAHSFLPLFTSMFLHGGWIHLLGNMLFLFIFGDNVEDKFGHGRYFVFYIVAGLAAAITQIYFNAASEAPMIGASGAIAGVMGAYVLMFPKARITTLIFIIIFIKIIELPAYVFLGLWFLMQIFSGMMALGIGSDAGGVAWWAHIGGFAMGIVAVPFLKRR
ncbi:MAG: rhomboid family intramembrane serine protease [Bacteroidota bacterium]